MILVVDTNILFSFFYDDSFIKQILISPNNKFISSELAIKELKKYSSLIISKTRISKKEFSKKLNDLQSFVKFFPKKDYNNFLKKAEKFSPDKDDAEFLAICLKSNLPLWSNDKVLKEQDKVIVLNTKDIIDVIF